MAVPRLPPIYFCDWILFFLGLDSLVLDSLPCVSIQSLAVSRFKYSVFHDVSVSNLRSVPSCPCDTHPSGLGVD